MRDHLLLFQRLAWATLGPIAVQPVEARHCARQHLCVDGRGVGVGAASGESAARPLRGGGVARAGGGGAVRGASSIKMRTLLSVPSLPATTCKPRRERAQQRDDACLRDGDKCRMRGSTVMATLLTPNSLWKRASRRNAAEMGRRLRAVGEFR